MGKCEDEVIVIPSTYNNLPVLKIGDEAFMESSVRAVIISEGITEIGESAFESCRALESVFLPDSLEKIGEDAFKETDRLGVYENGALYVDDWAVSGRTSEVSTNYYDCKLRDDTAGIGPRALYNKFYGKLILPDSVKHINAYAFYFSRVEALILNDSITEIEPYAFAKAYSLKSITFGKYVSSIGEGAFSECSDLPKITIPETVTEIGDKAFEECSSLNAVMLPAGLTKIGSNAFNKCSNILYAEFKNVDGWFSDGEAIDSSTLSNAAEAAKLLKKPLGEWTKKIEN